MFTEIKKVFNEAISSDLPNDSNFYWIRLKGEKDFIGIPNGTITEREKQLLETIYPIERPFQYELTKRAQSWYTFFMSDGEIPTDGSKNCRVIQYSISNVHDDLSINEFKEALRSFFPNEVIIVPHSKFEGFIIESKSDIQLEENELLSAVQAFESDFFFKVHFFIGKFNQVNNSLKDLFKLEREFFYFSLNHYSKVQLVTIEKLLPFYTYMNMPNDIKPSLFATVKNLLNEDPDLTETIKTYIENHSNATLTAKQLFMHRNSLQYRIDKFIEKTHIDIKTFHGAYFAYLACIHAESDY